MKRYFMLVILLFGISMFLPATVGAKERKQAKPMIITTGDIREDYEVIDIIAVSIISDNLEKLQYKLKKEALKRKADAVVSVRYLLYGGRIYAYGTAVKLKD